MNVPMKGVETAGGWTLRSLHNPQVNHNDSNNYSSEYLDNIDLYTVITKDVGIPLSWHGYSQSYS